MGVWGRLWVNEAQLQLRRMEKGGGSGVGCTAFKVQKPLASKEGWLWIRLDHQASPTRHWVKVGITVLPPPISGGDCIVIAGNHLLLLANSGVRDLLVRVIFSTESSEWSSEWMHAA